MYAQIHNAVFRLWLFKVIYHKDFKCVLNFKSESCLIQFSLTDYMLKSTCLNAVLKWGLNVTYHKTLHHKQESLLLMICITVVPKFADQDQSLFVVGAVQI